MIINHNLSAMFASRQLGQTSEANTKSMEKLSSGMRINHAGDDASGLAVSEKMRSQVRGLNQAATNAQNGISFLQATEGYLVARLFNRADNKKHVHILGCTECRLSSKNDTYRQ